MFKLIKEIKSKEGVVHFRRWQILKTPWFSIYFHGIYKADEDEHLHNHPWNYVSICLWGSFFEASINLIKLIRPFSVSKQKSSRFHKILKLKSKVVYTLFFVSDRIDGEWGYLVNGKIIDL
jgi:hypothetical protein